MSSSQKARPAGPQQPERTRLQRRLLAWYDKNRRDLPWRRTRDPYAIWVSEVMLQQTQVSAILDYYRRWMQRFPDIGSLAQSDEADVLGVWQGLGYYSRARSLLKAARHVHEHHSGRLPDSVEELLALPGIGPYSAGAIASIAYGLQTPVIDGNVIRVLTRVFALRGDPARAPLKNQLWELARSLVPKARPGDFNQALMELGATRCTPREPACLSCPLRQQCQGHAQGIAKELPQSAARPRAEHQRHVALVVKRRSRFLLAQLSNGAPRWSGMWQFPCGIRRTRESAAAAIQRIGREVVSLNATSNEVLTTIRHSVTRYRIELEAHRCECRGTPRPAGPYSRAAWFNLDEFAALPLPAAHRRIAQRLHAAY